MRILVYEHVSGGGFANEPIPINVLSEGFGMLRTLTADFKAAGHTVSTTLDARLAKMNPPLTTNRTVPVISLRETQTKLHELSEQADVAYIVAPETDGVLQSLVDMVEQTAAISLNCQASAIEKVAEKTDFHEFMRKLGVPSPETILFSATDSLREITEAVRGSLNFPVVFKPVNGVSCGGVSVVRNEEQVTDAVSKIKKESSGKNFLVQELIKGIDTSVSLLSTGSSVVPVTLNGQEIKLETPEAFSSYSGGVVPFDNSLQAEAFEAAKKLVKSVPGLKGYVGVDFILTNEAAVAIEVNPRLTTSYIGLRRVVNFNPAQAMIDAVLKHDLPAKVESCGYLFFSKVETPSPTISLLQEVYGLNDVVSPPFPFSDARASALIASYGAALEEAMARFREAKKRVVNTISGGR